MSKIEKYKKVLGELYYKVPTSEIAERLKISVGSVRYYAYKLGLLRPARTKEITHNGRFFNERVHQDWIVGGKVDKY